MVLDYTSQVRQRTQAYILSSVKDPALTERIFHILHEPGKTLALPKSAVFSWSSTLINIGSLTGTVSHCTLDCALALDLFASAADIFDDLADDDNSTSAWSSLSKGEQLCLAMLLWQLSQNLLDQIQPLELMLQIKKRFNHAATQSCIGQSRDVFNITPSSLEDCYELAKQKSGSLGGLCCSLGALSSGADVRMVNHLEEIGVLFALVNQFSNDMRGILDPTQKSDILLRKITLPAAFCLFNRGSKIPPVLRDYYLHANPDLTATQITSLIINEGGIHYVQAVIDALNQELARAVDKLPMGPEERAQIVKIFYISSKNSAAADNST